MKLKTICLCLLFFTLLSTSGFTEETINLKPGQEEFRKLDSIKRISVADPYVVDAKVLSGGQQIMIRALNPGEATITIFDDREKKITFKVNVISTMSEEAKKVAALIKGVETVNVRVIDNQIVIEGSVIRAKDRKPLIKVKELYKDIKFLVENSVDKAQNYIVEGIESELPPTIDAKLLGDGVMLEGTVASNAEKSDAERIAKQYVENVYSVLKVKGVKIAATVNPVEFVMDVSGDTPSEKGLRILSEGLQMEKGLLGFALEDEMAADDVINELLNTYSGSSAFDGKSDYQQNGQFELALNNGERLYIFFQFDVVKKDLFKVAISLLDSQKKVLSRNEFYSKKIEPIGVTGFYNVLRNKKKMESGNRELLVVFELKS